MDRAEKGADTISLPTLIHAHNNPKIKLYFSEITAAFWRGGDYKQQQISSLLHLLFLELLFTTQSRQSQTSDLADQAIAKITAAPHIHYTCKAMADLLYVSTKTLDKSMLQKTGMSFHLYQKKCKLEMAASLLKTEPELHLREIADTLGFYDEFHLSKAFKQEYQMSPKEYRATSS
jgi:AraC-like DNA-binding protein